MDDLQSALVKTLMRRPSLARLTDVLVEHGVAIIGCAGDGRYRLVAARPRYRWAPVLGPIRADIMVGTYGGPITSLQPDRLEPWISCWIESHLPPLTDAQVRCLSYRARYGTRRLSRQIYDLLASRYHSGLQYYQRDITAELFGVRLVPRMPDGSERLPYGRTPEGDLIYRVSFGGRARWALVCQGRNPYWMDTGRQALHLLALRPERPPVYADDGALVGWRLWRVVHGSLHSVVRIYPWPSRVAHADTEPTPQNESGLYAVWPARGGTIRHHYHRVCIAAGALPCNFAIGQVRGYGAYVAGQEGWRAQRVIIDGIWVSHDVCARVVESLRRRYRVPVDVLPRDMGVERG